MDIRLPVERASGRGNEQPLFGWNICAHTCPGSSIGQAPLGAREGSQKKDEKYLLRVGNEASVGIRICRSELAAGQGSGKNVGLVRSQKSDSAKSFCVASGESLHLSAQFFHSSHM